MKDRYDLGIPEHDQVSAFYSFRPRYFKNLFLTLKKELPLSEDHLVIDLGTGQGQVACALAPYVSRVIAIDGSAQMLEKSKRHPKVDYRLADINDPSFKLTEVVDHAFMGRSVHWLNTNALQYIKKKYLKRNGAFVCLASSVSQNNECWRSVRPLLGPYQSLFINLPSNDEMRGGRKMSELGMQPENAFEGHAWANVTADQFVGYLLSIAYGESLALIKSNFQDFRSRVAFGLKPICDASGHFKCRIDNWAVIYRDHHRP
jgi:SAM-dependent methyltransferase